MASPNSKPSNPGKPSKPSTTSLSAAGLERYDLVEIHRNQVRGAPYNPRIISEKAKARLKIGMKKHGIVAPITWNKRTGHVVGGHQRLGILDSLAGTQDYTMRVAAVDVSEAQEKEMNLLLNNPSAMGDWDLELLRPMLEDPDVDFLSAGFQQDDVFQLFGDSVMQNKLAPELDALAEKVREMKERFKAIETKAKGGGATDFYCVVIFKDADERDVFLRKHGLEENRFQSGRDFERLLDERRTTATPAEDQHPAP